KGFHEKFEKLGRESIRNRKTDHNGNYTPKQALTKLCKVAQNGHLGFIPPILRTHLWISSLAVKVLDGRRSSSRRWHFLHGEMLCLTFAPFPANVPARRLERQSARSEVSRQIRFRTCLKYRLFGADSLTSCRDRA